MGLPKGYRFTDHPKSHLIRALIDDSDLLKLNECSKELGINKSELIRRWIDRQYNELKEKR